MDRSLEQQGRSPLAQAAGSPAPPSDQAATAPGGLEGGASAYVGFRALFRHTSEER